MESPETPVTEGIEPIGRTSNVIAATVSSCRAAQLRWRQTHLKERLAIVAKLRTLVVRDLEALSNVCGPLDASEALAAEILPLLDACEFLESNALSILKPRRLGRGGRPIWLSGVSAEVRREPLGVVLIVGPSNYPLMLPGIQAIQALVAGNGVLWKPAVGCSNAAQHVRGLLVEAGLDEGLFEILPEAVSSVEQAIDAGVDHVVLTGSAKTGRAIGARLAESAIPSTMELSGCDAVFVTASADVDRVVDCLLFGLLLNQGRTCIAPRRVFADPAVGERVREAFLAKLTSRLEVQKIACGDTAASRFAASLVVDAVADGALQLRDGIDRSDASRPFVSGPTVLDCVRPDMAIARSNVFVPVLCFLDAENPVTANNAQCPYALGASVFGEDRSETSKLVSEIEAGTVVVNDIVVPTADPRLPFGGRGQSGFGVTRGREGLEAMTQLKSVSVRRSRWMPHLDEPTPFDETVLSELIRVSHSNSPVAKLKAAWRLLQASWRQRSWRRNS